MSPGRGMPWSVIISGRAGVVPPSLCLLEVPVSSLVPAESPLGTIAKSFEMGVDVLWDQPRVLGCVCVRSGAWQDGRKGSTQPLGLECGWTGRATLAQMPGARWNSGAVPHGPLEKTGQYLSAPLLSFWKHWCIQSLLAPPARLCWFSPTRAVPWDCRGLATHEHPLLWAPSDSLINNLAWFL